MKKLKCLAAFLIPAILMPHLASANITGPYTTDANTLVLLHMDEASGGSVTTNVGSLGGNFITVNFSATGNPLPAVTTMLGVPSFSTTSPTTISFNSCESNTTSGYIIGYDYNKDGSFEGDTGAANPANSDYLTMTNLNVGNGGQTPFTLEALICPTTIANNEDIISTDSHNTQRCFFLRISSGALAFQYVGNGSTPPSQSVSANIPTLAQDPENGFVANTWYHVAFTYDGTNGTLYWTKLDPSLGAAHVLGSTPMAMGTAYGSGTGPLCIGNRGRSTGSETFPGAIDEVRISSVCRAANQMQFYSPLVTITQSPVNQNVDYNQPVTFSVGATTTGSTLGYQWLFNSNGIAGATNASYTIANVAADNAGYFDCVVTNTAGSSATSSVARLVVGAANFLNHRYSFLTTYTNLTTSQICTPDSIAGADGTNYGDAFETNGQLMLDGTTGTFLQLPPGIVNGSQETALTIEFWATFGGNANNAYAFTFGATNAGIGGHALLCYTPHNASGQETFISPADFAFAQTLAAPGVLDGEAVHVACIFDAPDGTMSIYTNGVLEATGPDTVGLGNINDVYSFIGASLNNGDPYLAANISELRIFNGALSPITIAQSQVQGPRILLASGPATFAVQPTGTSVPVGQTATFTAAAVGYLPITYQWFKNGTLVPGATNASYSFVPSLTDNNDSFICYATNTIGVTTYVTNSITVPLSVFLPPTLTWLGAVDGGADNNWNTTSLDWTNTTLGGGVIAFAETNGAVFDDRSGGGSVDLEQTIIPYNITVNAASSYTLTSSGGLGSLAGQGMLTKLNSGTLIIDLTNNMTGPIAISGGVLQIGNNDSFGTLGSGPVTNSATLSISRSDTILNVANAIHGSGTLSFDGFGAATLSGNNDFSGSTLINYGTVYLTSATGLGSTSSGTLVANGAQLYATANVDCSEPLTLNGQGGDGNGALRKGGAGATTEWGAISLGSASTIGVDSGATLTLSNVVSGAAALTAVGGGTLALEVNNTFNGGFTLNGPAVNVGTAGAIGPGPIAVTGAGRFVIANGLNIGNFFQISEVSPGAGLGSIMVNDNTNGIVTTISGPIEFDASPATGGDFVGPTTSGYLNITGPITNTASGIVSTRTGFVRFSGGGDYTLYDLDQGTTSLGANNGLCTSALLEMSVSAGAIFDMNGFSQVLSGVLDGGANSELVTNSATSTSTLTLNLGGSYTYSGVIAGNIALVENGSANFYLSGTNAYTGSTTVNGGLLELAQPGLAAGAPVIITNGATLQLDFSVTNQVSALVTNGISAGPGIYSSANALPYLTGSGYLFVSPGPSGPGYLTNSISGGTLTLTWPAGQGWRLVSQTDSLSSGLNPSPGAWSTVAGASDGRAAITVNSSGPVVFYRLVYP